MVAFGARIYFLTLLTVRCGHVVKNPFDIALRSVDFAGENKDPCRNLVSFSDVVFGSI